MASSSARPVRFAVLDVEITPAPTDEEREAILAALADEAQPPLPGDEEP